MPWITFLRRETPASLPPFSGSTSAPLRCGTPNSCCALCPWHLVLIRWQHWVFDFMSQVSLVPLPQGGGSRGTDIIVIIISCHLPLEMQFTATSKEGGLIVLLGSWGSEERFYSNNLCVWGLINIFIYCLIILCNILWTPSPALPSPFPSLGHSCTLYLELQKSWLKRELAKLFCSVF